MNGNGQTETAETPADTHEVDPLNELTIEIGGLDDAVMAASLRLARMRQALDALRAQRQADHARIAALEGQLAGLGVEA